MSVIVAASYSGIRQSLNAQGNNPRNCDANTPIPFVAAAIGAYRLLLKILHNIEQRKIGSIRLCLRKPDLRLTWCQAGNVMMIEAVRFEIISGMFFIC